MSRADWGFLENLLEESQEYSTGVGRVWLTVLFLFRILVLCTAAESAWDDEQTDFVCNTKQPGCEAVCYDKAFPFSHFRYFILQAVFVSTPSILYFGYVALGRHKDQQEGPDEKHERQKDKKCKETKLDVIQEESEDETQEKGLQKYPKLKGKLLGAYTISIVLKILIEIGFIVGLWFLYGFVIPARYECQRTPCPHTVDCFVSRPTEKTIFTIYIQIIALVSVLLNVVELFYLLQVFIAEYMEKKYQRKHEVYVPAENVRYAQSVKDGTKSKPHPTMDMLPTYLNCITGTAHRGHCREDVHTKPNKSSQQDKHPNDKNYV